MTFKIARIAMASVLALAAPAAAQQTGAANGMAQSWQDVVTPDVRFIQRDRQGNIVFDSAGEDLGTGVNDPDLARQIDEADGETPFATDPARPGWNREAQQADASIEPQITVIDNEPSERRATLAATPAPDIRDGQGDTGAMAQAATAGTESPETGSAMGGDMSATADAERDSAQGAQGMTAQVDDRPAPQTDGRYGGDMASAGQGQREMGIPGASAMDGADGLGGTMTTPSGMQFDMQEFAREMFEQGYRRGYVSGLTEMRARAVQQMREDREAFVQQQAAFERQARQQEEAMENVLDESAQGQQPQMQRPQMQRRGDGTTIIMLPPGMTPQQFLGSMR
jgi:hypothetical protein